jgi:hypothetical protein
MAFLKRDPAKSLETELAGLLKRRADLEERLGTAARAVDAANAERRRILLESDAVDSPALDRAEAACAGAQSHVEGLQDALRHLAEQVLDA